MVWNVVMTVVVCLLAALDGTAQIRDSARVTLPYAVVAGSVTLPAGEYTITDQEARSGAAVLVLRSDKGATATLLATPVSEPGGNMATSAKVVLRHSDGQYELKSVWMQGRSVGYEIVP